MCKQTTTKEIGHYLTLSERTIEQYRNNIMRKLNIRTRAGIIRLGWDDIT
ncbi:LuxR C-terminal-related transcriptional regulator [Niabella sp.]